MLDISLATSMAFLFKPSGNWRMNAPQGSHDDIVIALALFNWHYAGAYKIEEEAVFYGDDREVDKQPF